MQPESLQAANPIAPRAEPVALQFAEALAGTVVVAISDCYQYLEDTWPDIVRSTRSWLQYGTVGFAVLCIVIGAVEALFGK